MPSTDMIGVPTHIIFNGRLSMSTSARYDTIAARLHTALPELRPILAKPLICALVGMSQAVSAQQRAVAAAMP